jgi:flagellar hook protein FlgE
LTLTYNNGAGTGVGSTQTVTIDMTQMTQLASQPSSLAGNTDGASAGTLTSFSVGQGGDITGIYSNGYKQPLGQMAMATFANADGLMKAGGNLFSSSANSGTPQVGLPDTGSRGTIATGFLEGSNVDLAQQFTNMIMAERGFQANSRVITTSDEILQDLVNIKH